jgi:hypothetical protein
MRDSRFPDGTSALLVYDAACNAEFITEVSGQTIGPIFWLSTLEDETDRLSRNVGKKLLPHAA